MFNASHRIYFFPFYSAVDLTSAGHVALSRHGRSLISHVYEVLGEQGEGIDQIIPWHRPTSLHTIIVKHKNVSFNTICP